MEKDKYVQHILIAESVLYGVIADIVDRGNNTKREIGDRYDE